MIHFCFMSQTDSKRGLKVLTVSSRKKVDTFSAFSAKVQIVPYRCTLFFLLTALKQAEKQTIRPLNYKSARVEVDELLSSNNSKEAQQQNLVAIVILFYVVYPASSSDPPFSTYFPPSHSLFQKTILVASFSYFCSPSSSKSLHGNYRPLIGVRRFSAANQPLSVKVKVKSLSFLLS